MPRSAPSTRGCAISGAPSTRGSTIAPRSTRFGELARLEGILPALESAHAVAHAGRLAAELGPDDVVLVNLSGRGDKDLQSVARAREAQR